MEKLFDYHCFTCEYENEAWVEDPSTVLSCPECGANDYRRVYRTFGIIQDKVTDSSNSWVGPKSRRTYGKGRAVNGM